MSIGATTQTSATQTDLLALQNTANLLGKTQTALSTGKSVNSAADNAPTYFAAQALLSQASDLGNLKDNLSTSLTTINATTDALGSAGQVVQQLQGITTQALATTDPTARANLAKQYNALLPQLDGLVNDATFNGTNLINGSSSNLTIPLNGDKTASLTVSGSNATSGGLNLTPITDNFASSADINATNSQLQSALSTLRSSAASFGNNATLIQTNQDFTSNLANNLQTASSNLTLADTNAEGASLLAQQAQDQLGIISLGISGQLAQGILKYL